MMLLWIIPLGYLVLTFSLIPFMVHSMLDDHRQYTCHKKICKHNSHEWDAKTPEAVKKRNEVQRKCSANQVHHLAWVLPFLLLDRIPKAMSYGGTNRMFDRDARVKKLELEAKEREAELAKARELEANQTREAMRDFDKLMKMVEDGTVKV